MSNNFSVFLAWTGGAFWLVVAGVLLLIVYQESRSMFLAAIFTYRLSKADVFATLKAKHKYRFFVIRLWWSLYRHPRRAFVDGDGNMVWYPGTTLDDKIQYHRRESYHPVNTDKFDLDKLEGGL